MDEATFKTTTVGPDYRVTTDYNSHSLETEGDLVKPPRLEGKYWWLILCLMAATAVERAGRGSHWGQGGAVTGDPCAL